MSYCIMILVAGSALYLEPINKVGRDGWYSGTRRVEQCFRLQRARNCGRIRRQFHHWHHGAFNSHRFNGPNAKKKRSWTLKRLKWNISSNKTGSNEQWTVPDGWLLYCLQVFYAHQVLDSSKKVDVTLITFLSTQSLQIKQKHSEFFGGPMGRFSVGEGSHSKHTHLMAPRVSILIWVW